jgi:hypothetical protein
MKLDYFDNGENTDKPTLNPLPPLTNGVSGVLFTGVGFNFFEDKPSPIHELPEECLSDAEKFKGKFSNT